MDATGTGSGWEVTSGGDLKAKYTDTCVNFIDTRDNKTYATVQIGTQCWMKQNMNIGTMTAGANAQGTDCPSASAIEKYCYSNILANCNTTNNPFHPDGGLYQWNQAMCGSTTQGAKGICPTGWHIPTDAEQWTLENYLKDSGQTCSATRSGWGCATAGTKLKPGGSSDFNGNLTGNRHSNKLFYDRGEFAYIWSSSQSGADAWVRYLYSNNATVARNVFSKIFGLSIRCLKD